MKRDFVLRTQDSDVVIARKAYMTLDQAFGGWKKAARDHLGECAVWHAVPSMLFGGYYRNPRGDVIEML